MVTFGGYDQRCDPKELREERVLSEITYSSSLSDAASTQSRNLEVGIGIGQGECYSLAVSIAYLAMQPRTTCPGMAPPKVGWALPHQSFIKKCPRNYSDGGNSSTEIPSSLVNPPWCQVGKSSPAPRQRGMTSLRMWRGGWKEEQKKSRQHCQLFYGYSVVQHSALMKRY